MIARLFRSRPLLLSAAAILVFFISLDFAVIRLVAIERGLKDDIGDDMTWQITQAQFENVRFLDTVAQYVSGNEEVSPEDLQLRYDILLSRLKVFETGKPRNYLAQSGVLEKIDQHVIAVEALAPQIETLKPRDEEAEDTIRAATQPLTMFLRTATNQVMLEVRRRALALRDDRRDTLLEILGYLAGVLTSGAVLVILTIRARREIASKEESLRRQRELSQLYRTLVTMVTHQFGTPLAVIDSSAQRMIRRGCAMDAEEIEARSNYIREAVSGLLQMMQSTLNAARLDEGEISFRPRTTDLSQLIDTVCERHRHLYPDRRLLIEGTLADPSVFCDPTLIEGAFSNLVSNALKFSEKRTSVRVSSTLDDSFVNISVQDYGVGIPPDEIDQVFAQFFRARTGEKIAGTGIGLSFALNIARLHGGDITVTSTEGIGSTFTMRLPRRASIVSDAAAS